MTDLRDNAPLKMSRGVEVAKCANALLGIAFSSASSRSSWSSSTCICSTTAATCKNATNNTEHHNESENFLHIFYPLHLLSVVLPRGVPPYKYDEPRCKVIIVYARTFANDSVKFFSCYATFVVTAEFKTNFAGAVALVARRRVSRRI